VLVLSDHVVRPRKFHDLLVELARGCAWLRGRFSIATRPDCIGCAASDGGALRVGFCGIRGRAEQDEARLTLVVAGCAWLERVLRERVEACVWDTARVERDDPFPAWRPGDPWQPVFWGAV
jgi:hypothetical protein